MFFSLFNISNAQFSSASRCSLKLHTTTVKLLANVLLYHQKLGASFHNVDSTLLNMLCVTFAQYYTWKAVFKPSDKLYFSKLFAKRTRLIHLLLIFASLFIPGRSQGIDLSKKKIFRKGKTAKMDTTEAIPGRVWRWGRRSRDVSEGESSEIFHGP